MDPATFTRHITQAAKDAGYTGHGAAARLAKDTGVTESSISRMLTGKAIPQAQALEPLSKALSVPVVELLVLAGIVTREAIEQPPTSTRATAAALGITSPAHVDLYVAVVERLQSMEEA